MRNKSILILEDDILTADRIENYLVQMDYTDIRKANDYDRGIKLIEEKLPDVALLDIRLGRGPTGIDFANHLRSVSPETKVIFLTAQMDKCNIEKAKLVKPNGYIPKPIKLETLMAVLEFSFLDNRKIETQTEEEKVVYLKVDRIVHKIILSNIKYIETKHIYSFLYMNGEDRAKMFRLSMRELMETLSSDTFIQTHRSFAVNLKYSDEISKNSVRIDDSIIPISRNRYSAIKSAFKSYQLS